MSLIIAGMHVFLIAKVRFFLIRCWAAVAASFGRPPPPKTYLNFVIFRRKITYCAKHTLPVSRVFTNIEEK